MCAVFSLLQPAAPAVLLPGPSPSQLGFTLSLELLG